MRALILLLFASILLFSAYLISDKPVEGGARREEPVPQFETPAPATGKFLDPASLEETARAVEVLEPQAGVFDQPAEEWEEPAPLAETQWFDYEVAGGSGAEELELAAAIVHSTSAELAGVLRQRAVSEQRSELLLAFADELEGNRDLALGRLRRIPEDTDLHEAEIDIVRQALSGADSSSIRAALRAELFTVRAMGMRLLAREGDRALAAGDHKEAAGAFSQLLQSEIDAPWASDPRFLGIWSRGLREAQAGHRFHPKGDWPSFEVDVDHGDSLTMIRQKARVMRPGLVINVELIDRVNGLRGRYLQPGQVLRIPTDPVRSFVDLDARWVLVFFGDEVAAAYPCGIGAMGTETILGEFRIGDKQREPMWFPSGREPVAFGDPANPLGTRWLAWVEGDQKTGYGYHGTSDPTSIGKAASEGCVRMHNADVEELYEILPKDSPVTVRF